MDIIIEDTDDEDIEGILPNAPTSLTRIFGFTVAFLLTFRVLYNISDHAVVRLLRFFKHLFFSIGTAFGISELKQEVHFPQSIRGCYSYVNLDPELYQEYVVCPSCHTLYDQSVQTLVLGTQSNPESAKCLVVQFPNHPQLRFRQPCNTVLLHQVKKQQTLGFKPRKIYYYFGLKRALPILLNRPSFLNICNAWHKEKNTKEFLC